MKFDLLNWIDRIFTRLGNEKSVGTAFGIGTIFYGRSSVQQLVDEQATRAIAAGFRPTTYQVVQWIVIFFLPVIPLGTYRVMVDTGFWSIRKSTYAAQRVRWDWKQVAAHYFVGWLSLLALFNSWSFLFR